MIGIIIATHGKLAEGFKDAANVIIGDVKNIETVELYSGANVDDLGEEILGSIKKLNSSNGIIILTDLKGASPYNQSMLAIHKLPKELANKIYLISDVNMSILLEVITGQLSDESVEDIIENLDMDYWNIDKIEYNNDEDEDF